MYLIWKIMYIEFIKLCKLFQKQYPLNIQNCIHSSKNYIHCILGVIGPGIHIYIYIGLRA